MTLKDLNVETIYKDSKGLKRDPDKYSKELGEAHCLLWESKGKFGDFEWNSLNKLKTTINGVEYIFTPDSITNGFVDSERVIKGTNVKEKDAIKNYGNEVQSLVKEYQDTDYTIGSSIIFPVAINGEKIRWTMNIARGLSSLVHDRIDYTLECIKMFYEEKPNNPLQNALERSSKFFELFDSFEEYVDFFFLNDLVDSEGNVISFTGEIDFSNPFPQTKEKYKEYLTKMMTFVEKRNKRIQEYIDYK